MELVIILILIIILKYSNMFKHLPFNLIGCHNKSDFDRKASLAQLERKGRI
jgi:hypothetical protein